MYYPFHEEDDHLYWLLLALIVVALNINARKNQDYTNLKKSLSSCFQDQFL